MWTKRIFLITLTGLLAGCATQNAVTQLAARDTGCETSSIAVTELDAPQAATRRYQTEGCGTTHNYVCPTWQYYAMSAFNLYAMTESNELIDIDDPTHCMREKR